MSKRTLPRATRHAVALGSLAALWSAAAIVSCVGDEPDLALSEDAGADGDATTNGDGTVSDDGGGGSETSADASTDAPTEAALVIEPVAVDTHFHTTCALIANGRVRCWGLNSSLQAGAADAGEFASLPVEVEGVVDAVSVSTGYDHACALTKNGTVFCWGSNANGELARDLDDAGLSSAKALEVGGLPSVTKVSAGNGYTCVLTKGTKIICWGANGHGAVYAPEAGLPPPAPVFPTELVVPEAGALQFIDVRAQLSHTCAVANTGDSYCWGSNSFGELGRPMDGEYAPKKGAGSSSTKPKIMSGDTHTCIFDDVNGPRCFGGNFAGQLGNRVDAPLGDSTYIAAQVPGMNGPGVEEVGAGQTNTCVRFNDASVSCVGSNYHGQLGDPAADGGYHVTSVRVQGLTGALSVSVGTDHVCALRAASAPGGKQSVVCWGSNLLGQIGNGGDAGAPTPVVVPNLE